jgi:hypothetical protein
MNDVDEEPSPFREPVCDDEDVETGTRRGRKGEMWLWSCGAVELWWRVISCVRERDCCGVDTECL